MEQDCEDGIPKLEGDKSASAPSAISRSIRIGGSLFSRRSAIVPLCEEDGLLVLKEDVELCSKR